MQVLLAEFAGEKVVAKRVEVFSAVGAFGWGGGVEYGEAEFAQ